MRVVHVASGRLFGGVEQMLITIARHQAIAPGVNSAFAVAAPGRLAETLTASGIQQVHELGDVYLSRPHSVLLARRRFRALLQSRRADVSVCHAPWSYAIFASVAARAGVPVILWQHDLADGASIVERWAARTPAAMVIANSLYTAGTTSALQPGVPVKVIHPPVSIAGSNVESRTQLRRAMGVRSDEVVVLCASRLEPWKGHRNLIRALGHLRTSRPWRAWIAGGAQRPHERAYADELRREVASLGLESRVHFLGERHDVPDLMHAADVFCQPNERPEPFGVAFAESLLARLPVVTADMGGAPEIVSDECGRLVPPRDLPALVRALTGVIEDDDLRARLSAAGPPHAAARCAPAVILPQLTEALEQAAEVKRPRLSTASREPGA